MRAVDQSRINFSRRMGSRRPSIAVPGSHLGSSLVGKTKRSKAFTSHNKFVCGELGKESLYTRGVPEGVV
eukprot:scaffold108989_cov76-Phaeocystis_antarctica.AAC.1